MFGAKINSTVYATTKIDWDATMKGILQLTRSAKYALRTAAMAPHV